MIVLGKYLHKHSTLWCFVKKMARVSEGIDAALRAEQLAAMRYDPERLL